MLAIIFGWSKEATLEDRKLNARCLIDQSGVKDENMTMTFTDKGRLSNYARLRFSNQGLRDRSSLPWSNSLSGKVGISDAKDEDGCLEPGARMGPVTSRYDSRRKNRGNFEKMMFNVFKFYGYCPVKLFITSPITISVSSVQLVKLLVAGTQQMGWEDPAEWSSRVTNLGDEVGWRSSSATSYFYRYVDFFFYWNRSLSRCTQSIKTIQHSWQVMDWKQKDVNWDWQR